MSRFRTEEIEIKISFTTDGNVVNRVTGSSGSGSSVDSKKVMIAYLEQFGGLKIQPIDKQSLRRDLDMVIDKHLSHDREL